MSPAPEASTPASFGGTKILVLCPMRRGACTARRACDAGSLGPDAVVGRIVGPARRRRTRRSTGTLAAAGIGAADRS
jgi:hypothetical protein